MPAGFLFSSKNSLGGFWYMPTVMMLSDAAREEWQKNHKPAKRMFHRILILAFTMVHSLICFQEFYFIAQLFNSEFALDGCLLKTLQFSNTLPEFIRFLFHFH